MIDVHIRYCAVKATLSLNSIFIMYLIILIDVA